MMDFLAHHWLDMLTTLLGLLYIWLEYRTNIWLWVVGIIMPALDIVLYWDKELFGDSGMAAYYTGAHIWGFLSWKFRRQAGSKTKKLPVTHMPLRHYLPAAFTFIVAWYATWWVLVNYTRSPVPVTDAFTNALSFVALWALARKYVEQWLLWIVVDAVSVYLYITKGIPFKAGLYTIYIVIAVFGYRKWNQQAAKCNP